MPLPPILHVAFPNGHTDRMILRHFYTENENAAGCYYFGQLEKEVDACVAMTGCIGLEDVEFTILSERNKFSHMLRWKKDGNVEYVMSAFGVNILYTFYKTLDLIIILTGLLNGR